MAVTDKKKHEYTRIHLCKNVASDDRILQAKNQLKDMIQKEPRMQHKWSDTKWINDIVTILGAPKFGDQTAARQH